MSTRMLPTEALWDLTPGTVIPLWDDMYVTYRGEGFWEPGDNEDIDPMDDWQITLPSGMILAMSEFTAPYVGIHGDFDGVRHDTYDSGYLIRMTNDGEGAYVFHFRSA